MENSIVTVVVDFTISWDNELEILPVEVLRAEAKKVYLSKGIEGGMRVITTTLDAPVPGTKLAVRDRQANKPEPDASGDKL